MTPRTTAVAIGLVAGALTSACGQGAAPAGTPSRTDSVSGPVAVPVAAAPQPLVATRGDVRQPPSAQTPAAGECEEAAEGAEAVVELAADLPYPRCQVVRPGQRLRVVNVTGLDGEPASAVTVSFAGSAARRLAPGQELVFPGTFGELLLPGVHRLATDLYAGSGAELWLRT